MRLAPLYQKDRALAVEEGKIEGEQQMIIRLLNYRFGNIEPPLIERIKKLPIPKLESLGKALLSFTEIMDVVKWLTKNEELDF
ncbi:MAG TPA: DUF4351 domain-containing protein [Nostocaceae cyanobacterium]|nr:DUF4351 domain-containing protein [Nostocaceae cyanobacterium]